MPEVLDDLDRHIRVLARRPHPWLSEPPISQVAGPRDRNPLDHMFHLIQDDASEPARSDRAVRALAHVGVENPDALTVLLHALAPRLRQRLRRSVTSDHRAEALADLVFVITDAVASGEIDRLPRLAHRLVNRAHNRTYKRTRRYDLVRSPQLIDMTAPLPTADVADTVAARLDLTRFVRSVERSVAAGEISSRGWEAFRQQRLSRSLIGQGTGATVNDRNLASRAARKLQPHIQTHLRCHTP